MCHFGKMEATNGSSFLYTKSAMYILFSWPAFAHGPSAKRSGLLAVASKTSYSPCGSQLVSWDDLGL